MNIIRNIHGLQDWRTVRGNTLTVLLLYGSEKVGKTYIAHQIAEEYEGSKYYIDLAGESRQKFTNSFHNALDMLENRYLKYEDVAWNTMYNIFDDFVSSSKSTIIFDNAHLCAELCHNIKMFAKGLNNQIILIVDSNEVSKLKNFSVTSSPLYKVDVEYVSFREYLISKIKCSGKSCDAENLSSVLDEFGDELANTVVEYTVLGGYPEVLSKFLDNGIFDEALTVQKNLIEDILKKYNPYLTYNDFIRKIADICTNRENDKGLEIFLKSRHLMLAVAKKDGIDTEKANTIIELGLLYRVVTDSKNKDFISETTIISFVYNVLFFKLISNKIKATRIDMEVIHKSQSNYSTLISVITEKNTKIVIAINSDLTLKIIYNANNKLEEINTSLFSFACMNFDNIGDTSNEEFNAFYLGLFS